MDGPPFDRTAFFNCPFDDAYAPLLEAALFCVVSFGLTPRLANERLESGENRLDKIVEIAAASRFSFHDLSRCRAAEAGDYMRMSMPFELGIHLELRRSGAAPFDRKKFLIFEGEPYELKRALSDLNGQDVEFHRGDYELVVKKVRDFFRVEGGIAVPGPSRLLSDYADFQGRMVEKKIHEGHSAAEATRLPTRERLDEMVA